MPDMPVLDRLERLNLGTVTPHCVPDRIYVEWHVMRRNPSGGAYAALSGSEENVSDVCDALAALPDLIAVARAAKSLRNEVSGALHLAEPEIRAAIGNTNLGCIWRRVEELQAALAALEARNGQ